ncbi:glycosyltransferase family 4 protein [Kineosporia babensis]|uniref:Glycosyltransferase family 4 protein n=1 Tax=Kineosporia babensis TaxID=499548 RepID=A0A9X1NH64_9ACTN|nr:glycosyltransferase family 4 protein [Kineosporia babensis]MCD5313191.1 glycosyltransferase family 4 protein [Kineosporia babensis]
MYVRHLGHPEGVDGVHRPTVQMPGSAPRPPAAFDPAWLASNLDDMQVVHVHALAPRMNAEHAQAAVEATRRAGRPLVVTAYHLSDPTGLDEAGYAQQLDVLLPAADQVITLTEPAAAEIARRWSVAADVQPHPHAVDFVRMRRERPARSQNGPFVVGVHLGSLRLPSDPVAVVAALAQAAREVAQVRLVVFAHDHLLDSDSTRYDPATIREIDRLVQAAGGTVKAHRPMTDSQLWDNIFGLDAALVPPFFGSHSVWPEACFDLGTQAIMPAANHAAQQQPLAGGLAYACDGAGVPDVASLAAAFGKAVAAGEVVRADPTARFNERVKVAEWLRNNYERLLAEKA